jgi:hypothetical protein
MELAVQDLTAKGVFGAKFTTATNNLLLNKNQIQRSQRAMKAKVLTILGIICKRSMQKD